MKGFVATRIVELAYQKFLRRINSGIDKILAGPNWQWKALCAVVVISLFRAFPNYDALQTNFFQAKWHDVQLKVDQPMLDTGRMFPAVSHESKLTFRLTVPVVAHLLHLHETGMLILSGVIGILLLYLALEIPFFLTQDRRIAFFISLSAACAWPGVAAFQELRGGYYDAVAICLLLAAMATSWSILAAVFLFLADWTDERALIASALVLLFYLCIESGRALRERVSKPAAVILATAFYLGLRAYITATHSYVVATEGVGLTVLSHQTAIIPLAIWTGLGGSWILVAAGAFALFVQKRKALALGFCAALILMIGSSLAITDVTRGMAYCLPAVFVGLAALRTSENIEQIERLAAVGATISILVPTYYIEGSTGLFWLYALPIQIVRWLLPN